MALKRMAVDKNNVVKVYDTNDLSSTISDGFIASACSPTQQVMCWSYLLIPHGVSQGDFLRVDFPRSFLLGFPRSSLKDVLLKEIAPSYCNQLFATNFFMLLQCIALLLASYCIFFSSSLLALLF